MLSSLLSWFRQRPAAVAEPRDDRDLIALFNEARTPADLKYVSVIARSRG